MLNAQETQRRREETVGEINHDILPEVLEPERFSGDVQSKRSKGKIMEDCLRLFGFGSKKFRAFIRWEIVESWYSGYLHLLLIFGGTLAIVSCCMYALSEPTRIDLVIMPITLLLANLLEYVVHRYPMHRKMKYLEGVFEHVIVHHGFFTEEAHTYEHHRDFRALFVPLSIVVAVFIILGGPLLFVLRSYVSPNIIFMLVASYWLYYLNYEFFHFASHAPANALILRIPGIKFVIRHHQLHHDPKLMSAYNFNITWPLFDWIFGTIYVRD